MSHYRTVVAGLCVVLTCIAGCGGQSSSNSTTPAVTSRSTVILDVTATPVPASPTAEQLTATPAPPAGQTTSSPTPAAGSTDEQTSTPLPDGAQTSNFSLTQLKYLLIARFGSVGTASGIFYCDPDQYPVARVLEPDQVLSRLNSIDKTSEEYHTVVQYLKLQSVSDLTDAQKLQIYQEYKMLNAISLEKQGDLYKFSLRVSQGVPGRKASGLSITGTITALGGITVLNQQPTVLSCPICLAFGTRIDTPGGPVLVQDLRPGMIVWTVEHSGIRTAARVLRTSHTPVPTGHLVIHLRLDDGRELRASAGHPTTDGRVLGSLAPGDVMDKARVLGATPERYEATETYDILPAGETGFYWANGILMGSTLSPSFEQPATSRAIR